MTYRAAYPVAARSTGRILPALLGSVLLTAAALKALQLASGPLPANSLLSSRWSVLALIELELALGLCLLLRLYPGRTRLVALSCFTIFGAVSLQQALAGRASCSCFGAVDVRPWYTFLFDVAAVTTLWRWQPNKNICSDEGGVRDFCTYPGQHSPSGYCSFRQAFSSLRPVRMALPRG